MDSFLQWIAANSHFVAGALGSATSAYFTQLKTWREKVFTFVAGWGAVYSLTDTLANYVRVDEKAIGYFIGFFALNLCAACLKAVRRFGDDADFWTLLCQAWTRILDRLAPATKSGKE